MDQQSHSEPVHSVQPAKAGMSTGVKVAIGCVVLVIVAGLCFALASVLGLAGLSKVATEVEADLDAQDQENDDNFNTPASLNEMVSVGDVEWTVTEATELGSSLESTYEYGDDCVANSGKFILIKVTIKNNSNEMVSVSDLDLYDSLKREYKTSSDVYGCIEDDLFIFDNINPGITKTFTAAYEVPADASDFRLKVGDLDFFSDSFMYIALGF